MLQGLRSGRLGSLSQWLAPGALDDGMVVMTSIYALIVGAMALTSLIRLSRARGGVLETLLVFGLTALLAAWTLGAATGGLFEIIALLAWSVFVFAPLVLLSVAVIRRQQRWSCIVCTSIAVALLAIAFRAFVVEPRSLEISHVEYRTSKIDRPLLVALIADLQTDAPGEYERDVLAQVAAARPDLVLWAGDYLQIDDDEAYAAAARKLRALLATSGIDAPLGMFVVEGNSETRPDWPALFEGTAVTPLASSRRLLLNEGLTLSALSLRDSFDTDIRIEAAQGLHIVLGHAPDYALGQIEADLLLAGHTHGGQVRIPGIGPIITLSRVPRAWAAGVTSLANGGVLIVSRGIGMERGPAPRLRFLCRPELVFVHVRPM